MKKRWWALTLLPVWVFLVAFFSPSCQQKEGLSNMKRVVVSIPPYRFLVEQIVGETMHVFSAVEPHFDPHSCEIRPWQMEKIGGASLFIGVGEIFEQKLLDAELTESSVSVVWAANRETPVRCRCHIVTLKRNVSTGR